ncbi:MAG: hypothetical protein DMG97_27280 [Acidobacteria bacterium]|nr:MAG: hypothetical protein DMG97_27280 [Acidobacteriota bacterium]
MKESGLSAVDLRAEVERGSFFCSNALPRMKSGSEYWRRVEDLYHRAVECNEPERQTLLDRECAADNELRREVEALLAGQERARSFLEEPAAERLTAGIRLSSYEIVEHIGSGGMGDVYRARDTKLNRSVAIKFLSADLADASARRRFQREAQMASSLNHPHILTVHDTGEFEGRQYLVTEFVDGGTLREWGRREQPSVRRIVGHWNRRRPGLCPSGWHLTP